MKTLKILAYVVLLWAVAGCAVVYRVPPALTPDQLAEVRNSPYSQLTLGIDSVPGVRDGKYLSQYALDEVLALFTRSGLFKDVNFTSQLSATPDLTVELHSGPRMPACTTGEASLMVMTLGIIPLMSGDKSYAFTITNPRKSKGLQAEFIYISESYFGSLSSLLALSPQWSTTRQDERNFERFAYELVSKKNEILTLVAD